MDVTQTIAEGTLSKNLAPDERGQFLHLDSQDKLAALNPWERILGMMLIHMSRPWTLGDYEYWLIRETIEFITRKIGLSLQNRKAPPAIMGEDWTDKAYLFSLTNGDYNFNPLYASDYYLHVTNFVEKCVKSEIEATGITEEFLENLLDLNINLEPMKVYQDFKYFGLDNDMNAYNRAISSWPAMKHIKEATPGLYYLYWYMSLTFPELEASNIHHPADAANQMMQLFGIQKGTDEWKSLLTLAKDELNDLRLGLSRISGKPSTSSHIFRECQRIIIKIRLMSGKQLSPSMVETFFRVVAQDIRGERPPEFFERYLHVFTTFLQYDGLRAMRQDFRNVVDWIRGTYPEPMALNRDWDYYCRRSYNWHTDAFAKNTTGGKEALERLRELLAGNYSSVQPEWDSVLGYQTDEDFVIAPLVNEVHLTDAGLVLQNCVGRSTSYKNQFIEDQSRLFLISSANQPATVRDMSLLEISRRGDGWKVSQHFASRNMPVSSKVEELGNIISKRYEELDRRSY